MPSDAPQNGVPITQDLLAEFQNPVHQWFLSTKGKLVVPSEDNERKGIRRDTSMLSSPEVEVSAYRVAREVSKNPVLFTEGVHRSLSAVRLGLMLGLFVSISYQRAANLDALVQESKRGNMAASRQAELQAKSQTASTIAMYVAAYYIVWELSQYRTEEIDSIRMDLPAHPPLTFGSTMLSLGTMVFSWTTLLERSGTVNTDPQFVKMTLLYFKKVIDNLLERKESIVYADPFTQNTYQLVGTNFSVAGFRAEMSGRGGSVEFKRVEMSSIVGNRDAKHFARRLAQRLVLYDPSLKKNVFQEIGSISRVAMGFGPPGTGKSMLIGAFGTMIADFCEILKLPFLYHPFPDTIVSTFQGGSAERAAEWFRPLQDPSRIVYGPIDDAENTLEERTRQGVSSGVREVIGVFLRKTEGAEAIDRGNTAIHILTNIPDQIDSAVRSRVVSRFLIDGAKNVEDFLDQDYLWWKRYQAMDPAFVNLKDPSGYHYLSAQKEVSSMGALYENYRDPRETVVREVLARAEKQASRREQKFFAVLFKEFQSQFPTFTSRDVRNIQSAVSERITDFDLPEVWFENLELFFGKDYETKKNMLIELMKGSMKGLSLAEVRFQEAVRYLDNWIEIQDQGFERQVKEFVERTRVQEEGVRRIQTKHH